YDGEIDFTKGRVVLWFSIPGCGPKTCKQAGTCPPDIIPKVEGGGPKTCKQAGTCPPDIIPKVEGGGPKTCKQAGTCPPDIIPKVEGGGPCRLVERFMTELSEYFEDIQ
ncbi:minor capsid protein L2, partial [Lacticaseibacillus paracasei]|uniref:minor capsid protein L2 n=1 Tax=Lacticaseibacillus paracasei TaxID=1597 RepID=UPI00194E47E2